MARYYDSANTYSETFSGPGVTTVIYCRLFGEMITDRICMLRRQVPRLKSGLSCKGCIMNIAIDQGKIPGC